MRIKSLYFSLTFIFLPTYQLFAAADPWNNIDSLKRVLERNNLSGKELIDTRNLLAWGYLKEKPIPPFYLVTNWLKKLMILITIRGWAMPG